MKAKVKAEGRPAVLVVSGGFDASGMRVSRSFVEMSSCGKKVHRIGWTILRGLTDKMERNAVGAAVGRR
ncbi:hypothetical protein [Streptomyces sp. NPDC093260]|uniref:hypothetical protein n=1 Tax=Streptomyces sp. NPDC093260 TaxID=3155073 RepID=UPI003440074E